MYGTFPTPKECVKFRDNDYSEGYSQWVHRASENTKKKIRQIQCMKCQRWCFPEDQCNLFEPFPKKQKE